MSTQTYDALIVLGMNIRKINGSYLPTTYDDFDEFGMLAGEMNIIAAELLYKAGKTNTFVFSTGTSAKTRAAFGDEVPTEAEVYSREFRKRIEGGNPTIILEDRSVNTHSNLVECAQIIIEHGWKSVAIMSAKYHVPRVEALWNLIMQGQQLDSKITFLVAEDIIQKYAPGTYDQRIAEAYESEEGRKRLANEAQGLEDMRSGKYVVTEFQLQKS